MLLNENLNMTAHFDETIASSCVLYQNLNEFGNIEIIKGKIETVPTTLIR